MRPKGFTLMEIMVALTIFAILSVSLMGQSAQQLAGARQADLQLAGGMLAENELNRVLSRKEWAPLGQIEYPVGYGNSRFTVRVSSTATDFPLLRRIEVAVVDGKQARQGRELARLVGFRGQYQD